MKKINNQIVLLLAFYQLIITYTAHSQSVNNDSLVVMKFSNKNDIVYFFKEKPYTGESYNIGSTIDTIKYKNGQIISVNKYKNNKLLLREKYKNNKKNGSYVEYFENGNIKVSGYYKKGAKNGKWIWKDANGNLVENKKYHNYIEKNIPIQNINNTICINDSINLSINYKNQLLVLEIQNLSNMYLYIDSLNIKLLNDTLKILPFQDSLDNSVIKIIKLNIIEPLETIEILINKKNYVSIFDIQINYIYNNGSKPITPGNKNSSYVMINREIFLKRKCVKSFVYHR